MPQEFFDALVISSVACFQHNLLCRAVGLSEQIKLVSWKILRWLDLNDCN